MLEKQGKDPANIKCFHKKRYTGMLIRFGRTLVYISKRLGAFEAEVWACVIYVLPSCLVSPVVN